MSTFSDGPEFSISLVNLNKLDASADKFLYYDNIFDGLSQPVSYSSQGMYC